MLNKLKKAKKNNKGFSLVELIIVVAILAILVGILAPQYIKWVEKSRVAKDETNADELLNAVQVAIADDSYEIDETMTASLAAGGVTASNEILKGALNDIYGSENLEKAGLVSSEYKARTYTVTIKKGADNGLTASGDWTPKS